MGLSDGLNSGLQVNGNVPRISCSEMEEGNSRKETPQGSNNSPEHFTDEAEAQTVIRVGPHRIAYKCIHIPGPLVKLDICLHYPRAEDRCAGLLTLFAPFPCGALNRSLLPPFQY